MKDKYIAGIFCAVILALLFASNVRCQEWNAQMQTFADYTEKKYDLPSGTCRAFALQESGYNQYAERVEGNYVEATGSYATKIRRDAHIFAQDHKWQPSYLTEIYNRGKSVGLFQIMGQNLRAMGYNEPFLNHISLTDQFEYFGKFLSPVLKKYHGNLAFAASEYNGGAGAVRGGNFRNPDYVRNIVRYQKQFSQ